MNLGKKLGIAGALCMVFLGTASSVYADKYKCMIMEKNKEDDARLIHSFELDSDKLDSNGQAEFGVKNLWGYCGFNQDAFAPVKSQDVDLLCGIVDTTDSSNKMPTKKLNLKSTKIEALAISAVGTPRVTALTQGGDWYFFAHCNK